MMNVDTTQLFERLNSGRLGDTPVRVVNGKIVFLDHYSDMPNLNFAHAFHNTPVRLFANISTTKGDVVDEFMTDNPLVFQCKFNELLKRYPQVVR
ncbi:hypothetical protein [Pseudolabrys sp.]|uniref:hypothetical protein n=1 Tax=Pseudolabrys sp. TaxID=1960880 RepID=UPI003D0E9437